MAHCERAESGETGTRRRERGDVLKRKTEDSKPGILCSFFSQASMSVRVCLMTMRAVPAAPSAGGFSLLSVLHHPPDDQPEDSKDDQGCDDGIDICSQPCEHGKASLESDECRRHVMIAFSK